MMKKTKKRLTRLFAVCLGLIVMLSACASVDAPSGESTATEESKETSALELSEVNAESTSSEAEPSAPDEHISADDEASLSGDITITPIEPTYPEERETTLEFVKEYPLGERGIPFYLEYYDDPEYAGITTPLDYFIDENGKLFAQMGRFILDIEANDAVELKNSVSGWYVSNGNIYSVTYDGMLEVYSPEGELISSVQIVEKNSFKNINIYPTDGSPIVRVDSALFSSDGKIVTDRFTMGENQNVLTVNGVANAVEIGKGFWVMSDQNGLLTVKNHRYTSFENRNWVDEYIFYQFGADGNPISEFAVYQLWTPENLPCNVVSGDAVCKWYRGQTVQIGKSEFERVMSSDYFVGADNQFYALMIYPDRAELYRISPGYSNVTPIDFAAIDNPDGVFGVFEGTVAETALSVSENVAAEAATTAADHIDFSPLEVYASADAMCEMTWTLQAGHKNTNGCRCNDVIHAIQLPRYLSSAVNGRKMTGIPYC